MNESKLQEIARLCAFCFGQDHDYTPNHADEEWQAHGWVIEAMKAALAAAPSPAPVPVDPAEIEALRRDAACFQWLMSLQSGRPESQIALAQVILAMRKNQEAVRKFIEGQIALAANGEKGT